MLTGATVGGWAQAAPAAFYRSFPGFGRHWLPPLGPYNEHLVRDFGALNLGLATAALVAAITLTRSATAVAAAAWLVYSVPHVAFHAAHGAPFTAGDDIAVLASLSAAAAIAATAWWLVATTPSPRPPEPNQLQAVERKVTACPRWRVSVTNEPGRASRCCCCTASAIAGRCGTRWSTVWMTGST